MEPRLDGEAALRPGARRARGHAMPAGYVPPERRQGAAAAAAASGHQGGFGGHHMNHIHHEHVAASGRPPPAPAAAGAGARSAADAGARSAGARGRSARPPPTRAEGRRRRPARAGAHGGGRRGAGAGAGAAALRWVRARLRPGGGARRREAEVEEADALAAAAAGGDAGAGADVIASCVESNGSKRVLHVATHGCRQLNQHVYSTINRNYGSVIRQLLSFNEWASSFLLPDGYPHSVTASFTPYMRWRAVQYFFGGALGVFTTRSLMASLGVGQAGSKAAALNWVLKDGAGRLGRMVFARYGRQLDNDLKQFRFLGDLLMECGAALELSTMFMPGAFLPLACIANISKNVAVATAHSTRAPIYRAFSADQVNHTNLGDITAKGESIGNLADIVGLGVGVLVSKFNPPLFPTFVFLSSMYIFSSVKECSCVQLPIFNHARLAVVLRRYFDDGSVMAPAEANSMEPLLFGYRSMNLPSFGSAVRRRPRPAAGGAGDDAAAGDAAAGDVPALQSLAESVIGRRAVDFGRHRVVMGTSVGTAFDSGARFARAVRLYSGESFMISYRPDDKTAYVVLRDGVDHNSDVMLRATFQAHLLLHRLQMAQEERERQLGAEAWAPPAAQPPLQALLAGPRSLLTDEDLGRCSQAAHALSAQCFPRFVEAANEQGWDTDTLMLSAGRWRVVRSDPRDAAAAP